VPDLLRLLPSLRPELPSSVDIFSYKLLVVSEKFEADIGFVDVTVSSVCYGMPNLSILASVCVCHSYLEMGGH
jgi:hypothetical protein